MTIFGIVVDAWTLGEVTPAVDWGAVSLTCGCIAATVGCCEIIAAAAVLRLDRKSEHCDRLREAGVDLVTRLWNAEMVGKCWLTWSSQFCGALA